MDSGRLSHILNELESPERQQPTMIFLLGGEGKEEALDSLFENYMTQNKPEKSNMTINLRREAGGDHAPVLFVDGDLRATLSVQQSESYLRKTTYSALWADGGSEDVISLVYARLLFLFCDIVCIFAEDFPSLDHVAHFLLFVAQAGSASTLPVPVRPTALVVLGRGSETHRLEMNKFHRTISAHRSRIAESFSTVRTITLGSYDRLRSFLQHHLDHAANIRSAHRARFTAVHLDSLFQAALRHTAMTVTEPFDHIREMRVGNEVPAGLTFHLTNYFRLGFRAEISVGDLVPSIASAIVADNYPPRAHCKPPLSTIPKLHAKIPVSDPNLVFERLYREPLLEAFLWLCKEQPSLSLVPEAACELVRVEANRFFSSVEEAGRPSTELHQEQLMSQSALFCRVKSNRTCLWCRFRKPEHRPACGHGLCEICVRRYGDPASDTEYRLTIRLCYLCLSRAPLTIDLVPPTKRISSLAIDGGGVRGVIPLEFLLLVQEKLGANCPVVDLCELVMGTSSGEHFLSVSTFRH